MANYSEVTVVKLNAIAFQYKDAINRSLSSILNQPKYRNTGSGAASLHVEVIEGDANKAPQIIVTFDDYLLYMDKRKLQWTKLPEIKKLLAWAETKTSSPKEAKKLAWAVAWDKKKHDTWKAKPWRKKGLSGVLKEMNKMVVQEFENAINEDFKKSGVVPQ